MKNIILFIVTVYVLVSCSKSSSPNPVTPTPVPSSFSLSSLTINDNFSGFKYFNINTLPVIRFTFSDKIDHNSATSAFSFQDAMGSNISYSTSFTNNDSTLLIQPTKALKSISSYSLTATTSLLSQTKGTLLSAVTVNFTTSIDSSDKFPRISDSALLDLVQKQTFKYFWDFAHPASGLARERSNGDNSIVTSGGSGFGIMTIITGIHRHFISRTEGLSRMQTIVGFLKNTANKFHGAFPHWLNGQTGAVVPFSTKDNGADLVETSYLMQGLLCARQYFNGTDAAETALRNDINELWNGVEWSWFRKNTENVLYWHWSPNYSWDMNMPIKGWNECLITYVLAASSPTYAIPKIVYDNGWAQNGAIRNGNSYYGYTLPLGSNKGGPLFFSQYSFLGINPNGLTDPYADYKTQVTNHTKINFEYCKANPNHYFGYSEQCWGLTASDIPNGYTASSPTNDVGVIAPTAALSSFPYTPVESMNALKFFYYKLGDRIWGEYGFRDAFSLKEPWFANSYLAIDQGPAIVMIENYRSGLLWNLFMSCPEIKTGMQNLQFQSPQL